MCGFAGVFSGPPRLLGAHWSLSAFFEAANRLQHRGDSAAGHAFGPGPDAETASYWLSHHRLAFQDLGRGHQPMIDSSGTWLIVFNGEIYNHLELRKTRHSLRDVAFRTHSDTETLLEGFAREGSAFFAELDGEYAFVVVRRDASELVAHRDPSGVKPLFFHLAGIDTALFAGHRESYAFETDELAFASEIKGLITPRRWDREGLCKQFVGLYEPIRTPFVGTIALAPGATFVAKARDPNQGRSSLSCHLDLPRAPLRPIASLARSEATPEPSQFLACLRASVEDRLLSDVELGVYLSGGVDSRAVAALLAGLKERSPHPRHAFTVGFEHRGFDETRDALEFARFCGFQSHVLRLDDAALAYAYAHAVTASENVQPYTNGAAKWWLSLMTRRHVHGVLTGDGSDELLCGYPSFRYVKWWMHVMRARKNNLERLRELPLGSLRRDMLYAEAFSEQTKDPWQAGSSAQGLGLDFVDSLSMWGVAHPLQGQIATLASLLLGADAPYWLEAQGPDIRSWFLAGFKAAEAPDPRDPRVALLLWQNYFFRTHLPVQVLNWVGDRMEMANTLEGRTPFLSRRMRQLVSQMPDRSLIHGFQDKWILRQALSRLIPSSFAMQPKKQFGAPFLLSEQSATRPSWSDGLHAVGLDEAAILGRLKAAQTRVEGILSGASAEQQPASSLSSDTSSRSVPGGVDLRVTEARYELSALTQFRQTLTCLAHVDGSIVQNNPPKRDRAYEETVLATERLVHPSTTPS